MLYSFIHISTLIFVVSLHMLQWIILTQRKFLLQIAYGCSFHIKILKSMHTYNITSTAVNKTIFR